MSKLSVSEAAKRFRVSRPTLQKALKDGVITGQRVVHNGVETWQIDVSELARVYSPRKSEAAPKVERVAMSNYDLTDNEKADLSGVSRHLYGELQAKLDIVQAKLAEAEKAAAVAAARAEERQNQLEEVRKDLDAARQEKAALIAALPKPDGTQKKRGFLRSLFKG